MRFMVNLMTLPKINILAICLFILLLPLPQNSDAFEWQDLWQTKEQQAQQEYLNGNYQQAAEQFTDPAWQAAARYKADKKLTEDEQLLPATSDTGFYNQGNLLAKSGQLEKAISAYDEALKLNPDNKDAQYNKQLVEKSLEQQKQQQQYQDKDQQQEKDQSGDQQDQQKQQGQQGEQSEQQESQEAGESDKQQQQDASAEADQQQDKENEQQKNAQAQEQENQQQEQEAETAKASETDIQDSEQQQASKQWLKRIPDNPSGLLKRKFKYQYGRIQQPHQSEQQW
ncbi:tetratricopeptide repeat protein [Bathymodiolus japonicus methanotrophic gill symbiont]|uniref:tetratricopeptide repeat protein n=1 Tax=Bathymodiolus japonicus methanotrophic gill symbiont TaxID=113269 RepID=UPI001C8ECE8E|nr:tetratricopeptide repeat protein [Bathymodiolus japonicus methanotrophic gill symbiont]